jgi:signal transduction histidine kinase
MPFSATPSTGVDPISGRTTEEELRHRYTLVKMVAAISARLVSITPETRDEILDATLARLAESTGVDRAYLFRVSPDRKVMINTHEWCAPGIAPQIHNLQAFTMPPWLASHFLGGKPVRLASVARDLPPEAVAEREEFEREGILSLLNVPLMHDGILLGVLGFDSVRHETAWSEQDLELLKIVGDILTSALERLDDQQALHRAKEAAEAAAHAKSMFLAHMSHELRTPLNGVIGLSTMVLKAERRQEREALARTIRLSAETLLTTIGDILDFSRIESGSLELERISLEPEGPLEEALDLVSPHLRQERPDAVELVRQRPGAPLTPIQGDPARVRQILLNLLGNAIKFTDRGTISVAVAQRVLPDGHREVRYTVRDTGIGISPEQQAQLFRPFSQADPSMTRRFGGTGLGLAICRRLCELMGGRIWVESTLGKGSSFHFTVVGPEAPRAAPLETPGNPGESLEVRRELHILVAEDHSINQMVVQLMLQELGHTVDLVADGEAAVMAVAQGGYDAVLMDVQMPRLSGLEATERILHGRAGGDPPPIIGLSAHATPEDRRMCLAAGMVDYLTKPLVLEELHAALERHT